MATLIGELTIGPDVVPFWWSRLSFSRRLGARGFPTGLLEQDGLWLLVEAAYAGVFMPAFGRPEGRAWPAAQARYLAGAGGAVQAWWDLEQVRCAHCSLDFDARGLGDGLPSHLCLVHLVARYWTSDFGRFDAWRGRLVPAAPAPRAELAPSNHAPTPGLRAVVGQTVPPSKPVVVLPGGAKGGWNKALNGDLQPNTVYEVDGIAYETDGLGRVERTVISGLKIRPRDRNTHQQTKSVALKDGLPGDQGGHIVAARLGGPGEQINYHPMKGSLNQGAWKKMENDWAREIKLGKAVDVEVRAVFQGGAKRPVAFEADYFVDGTPYSKTFVN